MADTIVTRVNYPTQEIVPQKAVDLLDGTYALAVAPQGTLTVSGTVTVEDATVTFSALATAAMGNASPGAVVAANANRRALILTNISDTTGYFSIGSSTGLTVTTYTFRLLPYQTWEWSGVVATQAIYAVCGAAGKNIAYQEAV